MTEEEQKINWYAVLESGSMMAVLNLREYIKSLEKKLSVMDSFEKERALLIVEDTFEIERLNAQIEKMKCCQNCTHSILNECDNLVCELNWFNLRIDYPCVNYSKWELKE